MQSRVYIETSVVSYLTALPSRDIVQAASHMERDPIIEEIHAIREAFAREHDYDLAAMCRTLVRHQQESGRPVVSFSPNRLSADPADTLSPAPDGRAT